MSAEHKPALQSANMGEMVVINPATGYQGDVGGYTDPSTDSHFSAAGSCAGDGLRRVLEALAEQSTIKNNGEQ